MHPSTALSLLDMSQRGWQSQTYSFHFPLETRNSLKNQLITK